MRKYLIYIAIFALMLCLMTGCGSQESSDPSCADILNSFREMTEDGFDTVYVSGDSEYEDNYDNMYAIKRDLIDDGGIIYTEKGGLADEVSLFHLKDSADVKIAKEKLEDRLATRRNQFSGYKPEEVYKLDNAEIMVKGNYVALVISSDPPMTESLLKQAIQSNYDGFDG